MPRDIPSQGLYVPNSSSLPEAGGATSSRILTGPQLGNARIIKKISVVFAETIQRVGRRGWALHLATSLSVDLRRLRRIVRMRRAAWRNWEFIPSREPPLVLAGRQHLFWEAASRNID